MRGEVYPFSIKFCLSDGRTTPNFLLSHRPPTPYELELVNTTDTESVERFAPECSEEGRTRRWQYYNTAISEESCELEGVEYVTVEREVRASCLIPEVAQLLNHSFTVPEGVEYVDALNYIQTNYVEIQDPASPLYDSVLAGILGEDFPNVNCVVPNESCSTPVLENSVVNISTVGEETTNTIPKPIEDYTPLNTLGLTNVWVAGEDDGFSEDTAFMEEFLNPGETAYIRINTGVGYNCLGSRPLNPLIQNNSSDILQYEAGESLADIQTAHPSSCTDPNFAPFVHTGSQWYTAEVPDEGLVFEVSPTESCESADTVSTGTTLRYTIFDGCGGAEVLCGFFDPTQGLMLPIDFADFATSNMVVAIDSPYEERLRFLDGSVVYVVTPPCTPLTVNVREVEYLGVEVALLDVTFSKTEFYVMTCQYQIPEFGTCQVLPFEKGSFGYYESLETYPCNSELYDSSGLIIRRDDIPIAYQQFFEENYVSAISSGVYDLREDTDLRETPLRFYRFPDNCVSPFMNIENNLPFIGSYIFPLGISLDNDIINAFLDIAVANELITLEDRGLITGYELFRGDRRLDRGVLAKGLAYDIYKYKEGSDDRYYSNYPYNDLGSDRYNYTDVTRSTLIPHPYDGQGNSRYTFHSPDTHFNKPEIPPEVHFEGYQLGHSRGRFVEVDNHSEWVLLNRKGYVLATSLAVAEAALELGVIIGQGIIDSSANYYVGIIGNPLAPAGTISAIAIGITALATQVQKVGEYRYNWLRLLRENGRSLNFAKYYASEGWYNSFLPNCEEGNMFRGLAASKYVKSGNYKIGEAFSGDTTTLNNFHRESSVYLSISEDYLLQYPQNYINYDNNDVNYGLASRFTSSEAGVCSTDRSEEVTRNIGSPYVSLRRWLPRQYGEVSSIRWLPLSYCGDLLEDNDCEVVYGGDIFISRFSLKRKIPFFYTNAVGIANHTPFEYYSQRNIGHPRYYVDHQTVQREGLGAALFPDVADEINLDCTDGVSGIYFRQPSHFYLFSYGIPQFLVESEINVNYRYARKEAHEQFYPEVGDYIDWTQEENVSIKEDNTYHYNDTYSKSVTGLNTGLLPDTYNKEEYDCRFDSPNGVIYSRQDVSENDLSDPWLVYRPLDFHEFPTHMGRLVDLRGIESSQVLVRFENGVTLFNAVDQLRDRLTPENYLLGSGGIFASRPLESNLTDLGYAGTQHKAMVSCEFGHFWVDAKRGGVFQVDPNGGNLREITQGMRQWFKRHLPFKILREGIDGLSYRDVDNNYRGIGIAMGWDERFRRVFLTKKDFKLRPEYKGRITFRDNCFFLDEELEVEITNELIFERCCFTLGYSPLLKMWISYYSFHPDYYIDMVNHFKTGLNYPSEGEQGGLWSHLLTNKSYQVFYGKLHPWIIELPVPEIGSPRILETIRYWMDTRRYHNEFDFAEKRRIGFNKAWVYNHSQHSGELILKHGDPNNMRQRWEYPKQISNFQEEILVTEEDMRWVFNHLRNRVRDECNNVPIMNWDCNQILRTINPLALNYRCPLTERLRGDWLLVRFIQDEESRYHQIFKFFDYKNRSYD